MTAIDELNSSIASLAATVNTLAANVVSNATASNAEIAALQAAAAEGDDAAVEEAVASLTAMNATITTQANAVAAETAALQASLAPAPTVKTK